MTLEALVRSSAPHAPPDICQIIHINIHTSLILVLALPYTSIMYLIIINNFFNSLSLFCKHSVAAAAREDPIKV